MGMTDKQFASYRREQLQEFQRMLDLAIETKADDELIKGLEMAVAKAKSDVEA